MRALRKNCIWKIFNLLHGSISSWNPERRSQIQSGNFRDQYRPGRRSAEAAPACCSPRSGTRSPGWEKHWIERSPSSFQIIILTRKRSLYIVLLCSLLSNEKQILSVGNQILTCHYHPFLPFSCLNICVSLFKYKRKKCRIPGKYFFFIFIWISFNDMTSFD